MKKRLALIMAAALMVTGLSACGSDTSSSSSSGSDAAATEATTEATSETQTTDAATASSSGKMTGGVTSQESPETTAEGKSQDITITISNANDIAGISPFAAPQAGRNDIRYCIYDQLAIMSTPGGDVDTMAKQMAKTITKVDDNTYDIEIYDYIHDTAGNSITADDVVFCYTNTDELGVSGKFSRLFESMEKIDDYTVRLHIDPEKNALGSAQYLLQYVPIVSQAAWESQSEDEWAMNPICTGGYSISEYVSGGYTYLERNDDYWQTDESLRTYAFSGQAKEIKIIIQTEANQRATALQTGEADVVPKVASTDIGLFRNDDGTPKEGYNVLASMSSTSLCLQFNCSEDSICNNIELRKAIAYAVDAEGAMAGTYGATGYAASKELGNCKLADYNPEWDNEDFYDYNVDEAKAHLEASGITDPEVTLMVDQNADMGSLAVFVQSYLQAVGITCNIQQYDSAMITDYKWDPTMWDIRIEGCGNSDYCADAWNLTTTNDSHGVNSFLIYDETYDQLVSKAGSVSEHTQEAVDAVHDYLYEQCYALPFGNYYNYSAASDKLDIFPLHPFNYLLYGGFIFE